MNKYEQAEFILNCYKPDELKTKTLVDIMKEMTRLDNEISLLMLKYEKLRLEVIRRFPNLEINEEFKRKEKNEYFK